MDLHALKAEVAKRIQQLTFEVEQSAINHNMMAGALKEAQGLMTFLEAKLKEIAEAALKGAEQGAIGAVEDEIANTVAAPATQSTPNG
jgi:hypothetical protein